MVRGRKGDGGGCRKSDLILQNVRPTTSSVPFPLPYPRCYLTVPFNDSPK